MWPLEDSGEALDSWIHWLHRSSTGGLSARSFVRFRYTVFIPTYPFGVVSEMLLLYHALPVAKATGMYSLAMPNALNFGFSWHKFMIVRPLFPTLQRAPC